MDESRLVTRSMAREKKRKKKWASINHFIILCFILLKMSTEAFADEAEEAEDQTTANVNQRHSHEKKPRTKRRVFDHGGALRMIQHNYLGQMIQAFGVQLTMASHGVSTPAAPIYKINC
jgi:hypothetical protein